jgi:hypothetical protein
VAAVILPVPAYFEYIALARDGTIVVGGSVALGDEEPYAALARFTPAGELDPTFGINGIVATARAAPDDARERYAAHALKRSHARRRQRTSNRIRHFRSECQGYDSRLAVCAIFLNPPARHKTVLLTCKIFHCLSACASFASITPPAIK